MAFLLWSKNQTFVIFSEFLKLRSLPSLWEAVFESYAIDLLFVHIQSYQVFLVLIKK